MKIIPRRFFYLMLFLLASCTPTQSIKQAHDQLLHDTGFRIAESSPEEAPFLIKNHRGYEVLYRPQMGNVWGRYAARMVIGEVGRELGRVGQFLTGSYKSGVGSVVGSPLDRVLSSVIGQPLTFYFILKHDKSAAPRLDILSDFSTVTPDDREPFAERLGFTAGSIYSSDRAFVGRLMKNRALIDRVTEYRSQYIRVDDKAVSFVFAGSEGDWSAEIREHGGNSVLINSIVDSLADIADAIEP